MSMELLSVVIYALLIFIMVLLQSTYMAKTAGLVFSFGNREKAQPSKKPLGNRIDRTLENLKEGGIMYVPLAVLAVSTDVSNPWTYYAALTTIISRILYVPVYIFGVRIVRSLVFAPSLIAIPVMAYGVISGLAGGI